MLQGRFKCLGALGHALLQLGLGLVQGVLGLFALGDVHKGHHRTTHLALIEHRVAGILHRKAVATRTPEHLAVDAAGLALAKGVVDRAVVHWVMRSIPVRMVGEHMHVLPQHLLRFQANHAGPGRVDEDTQALQIDPKNPLARRGQHQAQRVAPGFGNAHGAVDRRLQRGASTVHGLHMQGLCHAYGRFNFLRHGFCRLGTTPMRRWT